MLYLHERGRNMPIKVDLTLPLFVKVPVASQELWIVMYICVLWYQIFLFSHDFLFHFEFATTLSVIFFIFILLHSNQFMLYFYTCIY
jgi:hypothetical protein